MNVNVMPHRDAELDVNSLAIRLIGLRDDGKLWMSGYKPEHECDKLPLSEEGKTVVKALVKLCLEHDIAPFCCIGSSDGLCTVDGIVSLGPAEYDDLLEKAVPFTAPTLILAKR